MHEIRRYSAFYFKVVLKRHIECRAAPESCLEERAQPFLEEVPDGLGLRKYVATLVATETERPFQIELLRSTDAFFGHDRS